MKKRVVAVLLSLSMCMATAAEATVASAADFSAEIAVTEDSEESETEEADNSEDAAEDSTVTIEDGDVSDEDQNDAEVTPEPSEDISDVDFGDGEDFSSDVTDTDVPEVVQEDDADVAGLTYTGEKVISNTEAILSYHRWKAETVDGKLKWRLHKYEGNKTDSVGSTETEEQEGVSSVESVQETEENSEAEVLSEDADAAQDTDVAQDVEVIPETETEVTPEPSEDNADAVGNANYYTQVDGLVQISTLDASGNIIFTAKYAFDEHGYLITGNSTVGVDGTYYYHFSTESEVKITKPEIDREYSEVVAPFNSELGQMQADKWIWDGIGFSYYNKNGIYEAKKEGIYKIDNEYYYLLSSGQPFVGEKNNITYNNKKGTYYFKRATSESDIPGKMARGTWIGLSRNNNTQWRYFGNDGRYQKKGVGAYKVLNNKSYLYLLDANGYLIKGKAAKGADGYYYMSNKYGVVYTNKLVKYGNYRYYFTGNGRRATWKNRWVQLSGTGSTSYGRYYYFGNVAGRVEEKKGMQKVTINNKFVGWFLFTSSGNNYQNAWSGSRYFLPDGRMASGVTKIGNKYYFFQRSSTSQYRGQMYKGTWIKYNSKYYYASSNGVLAASGWRRIKCDGQMYYFYFQNCTALTNRTIARGNQKGWLDARGRYTTGWVIIDDSRNIARYINPETGKWYKNTTAWIDGVNYRFNSYGNRVQDRTNEFKRSSYYLECDRINGVMTVYTDSSKQYPIKSIRVSVGNPGTPTTLGTFTLTRSARWQPLMGPSWGQYGTHVVNGIYVHSVASSQMNGNNLPAGEYLKLGNPASHGCIRACVADAKWVYENCNGSTLHVFDGTYSTTESFKGPLGRRPLTPLRGSQTFDPTDPEYADR